MRRASLPILLLTLPALGVLPGCFKRSTDAVRPLNPDRVIGEPGLSPGQFSYPRCLTSDGNALWVIDKAARVQKFDPTTGEVLAHFKMPEFENGKPTGITIAPGDRGEQLLYIPDTHYYRVMIYKPPTTLGLPVEPISQFGSYGTGPGQFLFLTDVAVVMNDDNSKVIRLFVSEYGGNDRISIYEPTAPNQYAFVRAFGAFGPSATADKIEFSRPQSMEIDDKRKHLIVTDACNHRVGVFDLDGNLIRWIGSPEATGAAPNQFCYPYGLCLLPDGTAMITEFGNHRVHHINPETGESLGIFGVAGRDKGQLNSPWGVTYLDNRLFVLDSGNHRILGEKLTELLSSALPERTPTRLAIELIPVPPEAP
ncbi:MAG: hypothetical protein IT432_14150 [Phycisphaerales bacterium]|nr:hypothetical protein [Phycisphaerales bacterium]